MNLVLIHPEDRAGDDRYRISGRRLKHITRVHRAAVGDQLRVGLVNGLIGNGTVTSIQPDSVELSVHLEIEPPAALPVHLILALPRPKVLKRVLRNASAMGVKYIVMINCYRVEKSYWQSPILAQDEVTEQMLLGLEQACDTVLPEVIFQPLFKPFVEDVLPPLIKDRTAFIAHPDADRPCPRQIGRPITLVVGPEGGFIPYEVEKLIAAGCSPISLGPRILTTETAVTALLARLF